MKIFGKELGIGIVLGLFCAVAMAAYIPNAITTGGTKYRIEQAKISSTGTVSAESSDWINGSASVSTGTYTMTLNSGIFSVAPICFSNVDNGFINGFSAINGVPSTSTVVVRTYNNSGVQTASDNALICMGQR